jgi:transposase
MLARLLQLHHKTYQRLARLRREAEKDGAYRVAKRLHAVLLNADGHSSGRIAQILKAPRSKTSEWLANYESYGEESLLEGQRSGRPARLSPIQRTALGDIIESGPVAHGLDSGVWTAPMIGRVIEDEFGEVFHPGHIRKMLTAMGFSVQRPKRLLARADANAQARWRRRTYPNIKKKPKQKGARLSSPTKPASDRTRPSMRLGRGSDVSRKSR